MLEGSLQIIKFRIETLPQFRSMHGWVGELCFKLLKIPGNRSCTSSSLRCISGNKTIEVVQPWCKHTNKI